ncbi:MAG TPA: siderophore-interacting protein [Pseudonocardiaceae bacterium]
MPKYPAFLAARFETRGVPCVVDGVEDLSPRFRRVHLSGEGLRGHEWAPCQVTSFRVSDTEFRHYTPDGYDPERGRMSILFYRHGATAGENDANGTDGAGGHAGTDGPGNGHRGGAPGQRWLTELGRGDEARPMVPGATRRFRATGESGTYWVFGDGTTVGLWYSLIRWLPAGSTVRGAVELPAAEMGLGRELLPGIDVLPEGERPGVALDGWLDAADGAAPDHVYLSGHAQTIQRLRSTLRGRFGVDKGVIRTHAYWATGRTGL